MEPSREINGPELQDRLKQQKNLIDRVFEYATFGLILVPLNPAKDLIGTRTNPQLLAFFGYQEDELPSMNALSHPDDLQQERELIRELLAGERDNYQLEKRFYHKDGHLIWARASISLLRDDDGQPVQILTALEDIDQRKTLEQQLRTLLQEREQEAQAREQQLQAKEQESQTQQRQQEERLEKENAQLTEEIKTLGEQLSEATANASKSAQFESQVNELQSVNRNLHQLLEQQRQQGQHLGQELQLNLDALLAPSLQRLKESGLSPDQLQSLEILEQNIEQLTSPHLDRINSLHQKLTTTELQVVDMIRQGLSSKDIADQLQLSPQTVQVHRRNIRRKLDLIESKINLRSYLASVQ